MKRSLLLNVTYACFDSISTDPDAVNSVGASRFVNFD